jgi:hypothetical protein
MAVHRRLLLPDNYQCAADKNAQGQGPERIYMKRIGAALQLNCVDSRSCLSSGNIDLASSIDEWKADWTYKLFASRQLFGRSKR